MDKIVLSRTEVAEAPRAGASENAPPAGATSDKIVLRRTEVAEASDGSPGIPRVAESSIVVVRASEVADGPKGGQGFRQTSHSPLSSQTGTVPNSAQVLLWLLTPLLPLLCLAALMTRLVLRDAPSWTQSAWMSHFNSRLVVGGLLWAVIALAVGVWPRPLVSTARPASESVAPAPAPPGHQTGASPSLEAERGKSLTTEELFARFKPLTVIVRSEGGNGTGIILEAGVKGTLIGTARHVVGDMEGRGSDLLGKNVHVESAQHDIATATIVGVHRTLDLALLWVPHAFAARDVCLPIRRASTINVGEDVLVIGHPNGPQRNSFSLAPGKISREIGNDRQVHLVAPLWHGFSGGPVLDSYGRLLGIAVQIEKDLQPVVRTRPGGEAEPLRGEGTLIPVPGLSRAAPAEPFLEVNEWHLNRVGSDRLADFAAKSPSVESEFPSQSGDNYTPAGDETQ